MIGNILILNDLEAEIFITSNFDVGYKASYASDGNKFYNRFIYNKYVSHRQTNKDELLIDIFNLEIQ